MADEVKVFYLWPGMAAPNDGFSTGRSLSDGGIVWSGTAGAFPTQDPAAGYTYMVHDATGAEISEYQSILALIDSIDDTTVTGTF
jgi:hypothetical protein